MKIENVREEILSCAKDPIYFFNKYVKIRHPTRGLIPFKTFPYQDKTIDCFLKKRLNVILKPRQMGFTEVTSAFVTWLMLFHPNQSILVLATKGDTAMSVVKKVRIALKNLPKWLLISNISINNRKSIELANGSYVKSVAKSADAGRSDALSLLIIDEAAHIAGFDEVWTSIRPTISTGGRIIMLSTPNGVGNVFQKVYSESENGKNDFNHIRVNWWEHPEHIQNLRLCEDTKKYTSDWYEKETADLSDREKAQEYECEFLSSGDTFFSPAVISTVEESLLLDIHDSLQDEGLVIFKEPVAKSNYIIGVDCSTGKAFDRGAACVLEIDSMEQVAELSIKAEPDSFASNLLDLGKKYNNAILVVESNAVGLAVLEHIKLDAYPALFYTENGAKAGEKIGQVGNAAPGSMENKYNHGIMTGGHNRMFMLKKLEELIRKKITTIHSKRFFHEMKTFVWHAAKPEAKYGCRDDLILATAIAVWIRENIFGGVYSNQSVVEALARSIKVNVTKNTQIHGASKNSDLVPARSMGQFSGNRVQYMHQLPNGKYIDIMKEFGFGMGVFIPRKG